MSDRQALITRFISSTRWASATRTALAGDASRRRYERLTDPASGQTAVLMDAPTDQGEDVRPFVKIAQHLTALGLSAPHILHQDATNGLLLIEDLGDDLFARVVAERPETEATLYEVATDLLVGLHQAPLPSGLAPYSPKVMTDMAALAYGFYQAGIRSTAQASGETKLRSLMLSLLTRYTQDDQVLIQRDYHAENLLWLPDRLGSARVGLLDFQDAMTGHRAYDLVSILQDARRDVPQQIETRMIRHYVTATGLDPARFETAYHLLGIQRNLRILGVFARLCMRDGKPQYINFIPRVWGYIQRSLDHPTLSDLAIRINADLPEPSFANLKKLTDKCSSLQTQ